VALIPRARTLRFEVVVLKTIWGNEQFCTVQRRARLDRKRKKRMSNKKWESPANGYAGTKMKDGSTHLAHKAERAVELDTGAVVAVTLHGADLGDTVTLARRVWP
jgi:transposase